MANINPTSINQRLAGLSNFAKPKRLEDPKEVEKKFDTFQKDFDRISDLKGVDRPSMGFFVGVKDIAPRESGDVNVPGVGSLRQTANGCVLQVLNKGMYGNMLGFVTYEFDKANQQVKTTEVQHEFAAGYMHRPASTTTYTMDLQSQKVDDFLIAPGDVHGTNAYAGLGKGLAKGADGGGPAHGALEAVSRPEPRLR
jgi:hypothetical protein